ncbi:hypothetical protein ES708_08824 [subsurface metagenome]
MAIAAVLSGVMSGGGLANMILGMFPPFSTAYSKWAYSRMPNVIPGLGDMIELRYRKKLSESEYQTHAAELGFNTAWADRLYESGAALLTGSDYIRLWRREEIEESDLDDHLSRLRFNKSGIEHLKKVTEYFPSPGDLVRFAVREVYTPATVEKFGMLEDLPEKFTTEALKAGVPKEQSDNFWGAHWILPSSGQGFEMFQRDVIEPDDLGMLLKALDIMPFWREKLTKIAYRTLTRVDVRRMHAMGKLDDTETYDAYRHYGNSPEDAERMLAFTKAYNSEGSKGLTRANVVKGFKLGMIAEGDLRTYLEAFGYGEGVVDFWVDMAVYEKTLDEIQVSKAELDAQYQRGMISESEYRQRLNAMDLPATYVEKAVAEVAAKESLKVRMPTRSDLEKWLLLQVIDEEYYVDEMRTLGYRQEDIEYYLTEIAFEVDTSRRKYLPITTYSRWLATGIIEESVFRKIAGGMEISAADIDRLVREVEAKKIESE